MCSEGVGVVADWLTGEYAGRLCVLLLCDCVFIFCCVCVASLWLCAVIEHSVDGLCSGFVLSTVSLQYKRRLCHTSHAAINRAVECDNRPSATETNGLYDILLD